MGRNKTDLENIEEIEVKGRLVFNIDVMLAKRKMSVGELAARVGITQANMSILKTGKAKAIKVDTIVKLCEILDCQPGDLFEYVSDTE
ncbi:MAG: helix-turn-helix transcriptional regulator [Lachnospiraceae bacterium]|nr:helix-turn-helix transcriptional regulator [Lachnospiraceae bacterium]